MITALVFVFALAAYARSKFGWVAFFFALFVVLSCAGCGGSSATPAPAAALTPPKSLHTSAVVVIGGSELFDGPTRHDFGACATNAGVAGGNSTAMLGLFSLGILNDYPGTVFLVANAFEIEGAALGWAELGYTPDQLRAIEYEARVHALDNFASMVNHVQVSGSRTVIVGVPDADAYNADLRALAASRGVEFVTTLAAVKVCP